MIGWIPAVSLANARSFIADDYPMRPTLLLVDDLLYRDILPRSRMGITMLSNICGCRKTGWRNPTGFLKNILSVVVCLISYIFIYDVLKIK